MTGTIQPKSHEKASKNTIGTVNIDNMSTSKNLTPCKTMRPPKTSSFRTMPTPRTNANQPTSDRQPSHLQNGLPPCRMHVLQAKGQVHKRNASLKKSPAPTQWKDFHEQVPTDKARDIVTILRLL